MMFWKRVEIYCGFSFKEFSELRDSLASKGIQFDYKQINLTNRTRHNRFGFNPKNPIMYYLYVNHKDYDQAMYLTSNRHVKAYH